MIIQGLILRCFPISRRNGGVERKSSQGACGDVVPAENDPKRVLLPVDDGRAPGTGCMPKESANNTYEMTGKRVLDAGYLYEMRTERGVSSSRAQVGGAGYDSFFVNPLGMGSHEGGIPIEYAGAALAATSIGILGKGFNNPLAFECSDCSFSVFDSGPGIETCTLLPCVGVDCSHAEGCDFSNCYPTPPATALHDIKFGGELCSAGCEPSESRQLPADAASCSASCEHTLDLKSLARSGYGSRQTAVADEFTAGLLQAPGRLEQQQSTHARSMPSGLNSSRCFPDAPLLSHGGAAGNSCKCGQTAPCSADITDDYDSALSSSDSDRAAAGAGPLRACAGIAEEEPCSYPQVMRVQLATSQEPLVLSPETLIDNEPNRTNVDVESLPEQQELDIEEEGTLSDGSDIAAAAINGTAPSDGFAPGTPPLGARDSGSATAGPGIMPRSGRESRPHCELGDRQAWSDRGDVEPAAMRDLRMRPSLPPRLQAPVQALLEPAQETHHGEKPCTLPRLLHSLPVYLASKDTLEEGGQVVLKPDIAASFFQTLPVTKSTPQSATQEQGSCASVLTSVRNDIIIAATNASTSLGSLPSLLLPTVPFAFMWPHLVPLLAEPSKRNSSDVIGNRTGSGSSGVDSNKFGLPAAQPIRLDTPEVADASQCVLLPDPGCSISGLAMTRLLIRQLGLLPEAPSAHEDVPPSQLPSAGGQMVPSPFATAMDTAASALHIASPIPAEQSVADLSPIQDEEDGFGDDHEAVSITCTLQLQFKGTATVTDANVYSLAVPAKFQPPADAAQETEQWDQEVVSAGAVAGATDDASILSSSESSSIFDGRGSSVLRGALSIASMQGWLEPQDWKPLREKYCGAQVGAQQTPSA